LRVRQSIFEQDGRGQAEVTVLRILHGSLFRSHCRT
jgi:hypothetical protein